MATRKRFRRPSMREQAIAFNAADRFYAAAADKEPLFQREVPKKRATLARVGPSEHQEQVAVIQWWAVACHGYGLPAFSLFAVPNGGARDPITGSRLKAEGVRPGALDLILAKPMDQFHGLFIEMKVKPNRLTPGQEEFIAHLQSVGYAASAHWSADSAIEAIKEYLA